VNLWTFLNRAEALWPKREAIIDGKRRLTYAELAQRVRRLANQLGKLGVKKGDVVSIIAPNCAEFIEAYFASALLGSILNPINRKLSVKEMAAIIRDAKVKTLIIHIDNCERLTELIVRAGVVEQLIFLRGMPQRRPSIMAFEYDALMKLDGGAIPGSDSEVSSGVDAVTTALDVAQLYYTSGSTGQPKGVMLTHTNVFVHALAAISELRLTESDVWLHAAPMFHLADAWAVFAITAIGGRHVILSAFDAWESLNLLERERVTITNLIPTMLTALLQDPTCKERKYKSLRKIMSGGAPIAPAVVRQIMDTFRCDYVQTYGMTEASPYLTLSLPNGDVSRLSEDELFQIQCRTGRPFLGVELRVVTTEGKDVEPDDQEVGEIIVRGPTITPGYWNLPEATAEAFKEGWLHTGDLAIMNESHSVNIVDRKKDVIITGGETVYSIQVENVLQEHPAVLESAVVGVPDDFWGEVVKAVVVLKEGQRVSESDLIEFVKANIAHFKAPKNIAFASELPKLSNGKIWKEGIKSLDFSEVKESRDARTEETTEESTRIQLGEENIPIDIAGSSIAEWVKLVSTKEMADKFSEADEASKVMLSEDRAPVSTESENEVADEIAVQGTIVIMESDTEALSGIDQSREEK
jgi:fatty-acyl-CoA synthase